MNTSPFLALALALIPCSAPSAPQPGGGCIPIVITQPLQSLQSCTGETDVLHVVATGTNPQYSWTHNGDPVAGETSDTITLLDVTTHDRGIWCVTVYNDCSSLMSCCRVSITNCGGQYCTLTQGAYGNPNGQWNGMNRLELITSLLAQGDLVLGQAGRSLTIQPGEASAQCIIDRLPAGSRPRALPDFGDQILDNDTCQTDPPLPVHSDRFQNVLLGQTITLALNLRLDPNLGSLVLCSQMTTDNGVFPIDPSVIEAMVTIGGGHSASSLLALANRALSGGDTLGVSIKLINSAVDALNNAFDECATLTGCD